jgi:predicted GIY-YIG superfamily endonuclease
VDSDEDRGSTPLASSLRFWSAAQSEACHAGAKRRRAALAGQQMQRFFYVYVLVSEADETIHYTGTTQDLQAGLTKRNQGLCAHPSKHRPWRIQTAIAFGSEVKARGIRKIFKNRF